MRTATLRALVWKDFRRIRKMLLVSAAIWLFPFILFLWFATQSDEYATIRGSWLGMVIGPGIVMSCFFSTFILPLLIAKITADEFDNRTANFMAYLPPSNCSTLASRTIVLLPCLLWPGISLAVISFFLTRGEIDTMLTLSIFVLISGVAWLTGLVVRKGLWALFFGFIAPAALMWLCIKFNLDSLRDWKITDDIIPLFSKIAILVGIVCFIAGWLYGLRWGRART